MRDKITPKKLNKSADERLIPNTGLIDALNILITSSEGETGNEGVIKAARGNEAIPYLTPTGQGVGKVIGAVTDERLKVIYMFLYSSVTAEHGVYVYDPYGNLPNGTAGYVRKVFTSTKFNFDEFGYVKGDVVYINHRTDVSGDERYEKDCILYFTDGRSEPKKLNVFRCLLDDAPLGEGPNETDFITACPKLGLKTLGARFTGDSSRSSSNFVNTKGFQFAYQLIYKDGVETAISPYSDIMFPPVIVKQGAQEVVDYTANNVLEIDFDTNIQNRDEIEKIRLLAREGNDGFFFAIDEFKKDENIVVTYNDNTTTIYNGADVANNTANELIYRFYNDRVVTGVDPNEVAKQYDALPKIAKAQAVINNRLMYGNYVDGFDEQPVSCTSTLIFAERPDDFVSGTIEVTDIIREIPGSNFLPNGQPCHQFNKATSYKIDCSGVPDLEPETLINLTIQVLPQQNFHLYDARNSYHQNAIRGDEGNYNFFYTEQFAQNNLDPHYQTYQTPEASGEGFLLGAPGHGNDSQQYFPYFGNNEGVIRGLRWSTVDGPPAETSSQSYIGRTFDAVVGTSAANPFIIPAAGSGGQLSFSVTLKTIEQENSPQRVANALAAALSGVTNFEAIGLGNFELVSADIIPTMSIDQGYQNFDRFYDRESTGKLVMGIGRKSELLGTAEIGGTAGGGDFSEYNQVDGAPIGYALLNKAEVDFMFEQNWGTGEWLYDSIETGDYNVSRADAPSSGGTAEVRLAVKDISDIELSTCMRRLDTRSLTMTFQDGSFPYQSAIPFTNNGDFAVYDNSPWFILNNSLLSQPSFSLDQYQSSLPPALSPNGGRDSLKRYLDVADGGDYAYLADDINFTLFRYADPEIRELSTNVKQLSWPDCALNVQTQVDYLGSTIDLDVDNETPGMDLFLNKYIDAGSNTGTVNGIEVTTTTFNGPHEFVQICHRPNKAEASRQNFACLHSIYPSDNFRFACGRATINQNVGNGANDGYVGLGIQGLDGQPKPNQDNLDYYNNTRFKFSLLDGAGGPGGLRRIDEGANSIFGSISYFSTIPRLVNTVNNATIQDGVFVQVGAGTFNDNEHGVSMTGVFWNGNIHSTEFCGYGVAKVAAKNLNETGNQNGVTLNQNGFLPLVQASYTTARSQDAFFMPGIIPYPYITLTNFGADDVGTTCLQTNGDPADPWTPPDAPAIYRPLLAFRDIQFYDVQDTWQDNTVTRFDAGFTKIRIYNRRNGATQAESSSFNSIIDAGDPKDRTFKTNAFHDFGIVYYDERGRHGFVNPATTVYVPGYSDTERGSNEGKGKVEIKLDFSDTVAPPWATNYKLVYAPNSTVESFVQHMAGGAYLAAGADAGGSSVIYVSLNYLQESTISYTSAFGARGPEGELNLYKYKSGDRLRVISYAQGDERVYPNKIDFDVLEVKNFGPFENPLWPETENRAPNWLQGQFLVLRNNPLAGGFSYEDVNQDQHFWGDNCLIEIYSPAKKKSETAVYYEIPDQSYTPAGADYLPFVQNGVLYPSELTVTKGDTWWRPIAMNIRKKQTGNEDVYAINVTPSGLVDVIRDTDPEAPAGTNPSVPNFLPVTAESMTASDLIDGDSSFIGRPNAYLPGAKESRREATITYSDFNNPEATKIKYSSFNYALSNYKDLNEEFGGIDYMMNESGDILVIQNERVSMVPASKTLFSDTSGANTVVASTNVLGTARTFGLRAGCDGNPESVAVTPENAVFFAHKTLGKIYKYQPGGGVTTISDKNMAAFFRRAFEDALKTSSMSGYSDIRIPGGYDPLTKEYLITIKDVPDDVEGGDDGGPTETAIYGCTDPTALNYNPFATVDDGSCEYEEVVEGCDQINLSFDPSSFSFGSNSLTEDQVDADGNPNVEYNVSVVVTNTGDGVATITDVAFNGVTYSNDFSLFFFTSPSPTPDVIGQTIAPGESETLILRWTPSAEYTIGEAAQLTIAASNDDGCSKTTDFVGISGSVSIPSSDTNTPPRYVKVYESGQSADTAPFAQPIGTGQWDGFFYIYYDNIVETIGFPAVGQVLENPVYFSTDPPYNSNNNNRTFTKTLFIETSGILPSENVKIIFGAAPDAGDPIPVGAPMVASENIDGAFLSGETEIVLDESILSQTQDALGFSQGGIQLQTLTCKDLTLTYNFADDKSGSESSGFGRILPGTNVWPAGAETNDEWYASTNSNALEKLSVTNDLRWTQTNTSFVTIQCPSDVATNFSTSNGEASRDITYIQELTATTKYNETNYGNVRNTPALIRQWCSLPECFEYDPVEGETTTPVIGLWTNPLYQNFMDFTNVQPEGNGLGHPETKLGPAPFKTAYGANWYNASPEVFSVITDRLYKMQKNRDCGGVAGCTIETACNYNPDATWNDGSCTFPDPDYDCDGNFTGIITGCTNSNATNYNPAATEDDGSCIISGCTNPAADNYDPTATQDDGSCIVFGCTDPTATNYNSQATNDDGSCEYPAGGCPAAFPCAMDDDGNGIVNAQDVSGALTAAVNGYVNDGFNEDGPRWGAFRSKWTAFANCTIPEIIAYFDTTGDGALNFSEDLPGLMSAFNDACIADNFTISDEIYDCTGNPGFGDFPNICSLLDGNEITLQKVLEMYSTATDGVYDNPNAIDFDGDGVATSNDRNVALELVGLTTDEAFLQQCEGYNPPSGFTPTPDGDVKTDSVTTKKQYPLCEDFPEGDVSCGCMDPAADNYDPMARAHSQSLCSYSEKQDSRETTTTKS